MPDTTEREQIEARIYGISAKRIHPDGREERIDPFELYLQPRESK